MDPFISYGTHTDGEILYGEADNIHNRDALAAAQLGINVFVRNSGAVNLARSCGADKITACSVTGSGVLDASLTFSMITDGSKTTSLISDYSTNPWVMIDLERSQSVYYVIYYNRNDCCGERFQSTEFYIGDDSSTYSNNHMCYQHDGSAYATTGAQAAGWVHKLMCSGEGRYFFAVRKVASEHLQVAEIEVWGVDASPAGGGASAFVPAAECASSVPADWNLGVPDACYIKYASTNSDGTTRTCDAGHIYFYISAQCMIDLGYTDGVTTSDAFQGEYVLTVTHHAYSPPGSTSRTVKIWWSNQKDVLSDTSGDYLMSARADPGAAVFAANDYLVLPAYSSSFWTAA